VKEVVDDGIAVHVQVLYATDIPELSHNLSMIFNNVGKITRNPHDYRLLFFLSQYVTKPFLHYFPSKRILQEAVTELLIAQWYEKKL
jgi:hypothetical protein